MQPESWALVFFFVCAAVVVSGCSMLLKEPDVSVRGVAPGSFSLRELVLDVTLEIDNPNAVGITLKTLSFDVFYQKEGTWVFLSHGEQTGITISPGLNEVTIPVRVENSALLGSLFEVVTQGEITLKIDGSTAPDLRLFAPKVPFSRTVTISL